jgi:LPS-assembly protein
LDLKRTCICLALGLFQCLTPWPALAVVDDTLSGTSEIRLPVSPPPKSADDASVRVVRHEIVKAVVPPPPDFAKSVENPTPSTGLPPTFDDKMILGQAGSPPPPPEFKGYSSSGPTLRGGVTPPATPNFSAPVVVMDQGAGPGEWKLTADRVIGQNDSEYIQAVGNASIIKGTDSLKADLIRYYKASHWVMLKGNVRVIWEGDLLEAEEAEFDLNSRVGWLKRGKIFVGQAHLYFETEYARKYSASSYRFQNAKITACDGEKPAWDFHAEEADITLDGRTKLWHSQFNAAGTPVAYSPYLSLPGGARRQSGLLVPEISQSSKRGVTVNQPYYWVIDDERDLTFFENVMSRRGVMQGFEYRHTDNPGTKGDWRLDYLNDRKTARTSSAEDDYLQSDGLTRPNSNRWWLRSKYNGFAFDPAWNLKVDLDMVSDQNYLREFNSGLSGFESTRRNFLKDFGRDIAVADSLTRTSTAFVSRSWDNFGVAAKLAWTQNLSYMNGNNPASKDPTVQTLPELNFFAFKNQVPGTPFDFEATSQFDYFWRQYGTRGIRTDIHPTLSLPLPLGPFTFIPTAGVRNTAYAVGGYTAEPATTTTNKTPARTMYEMGFTGFTELSRVYSLEDGRLDATAENVGKSQWGALRHSIVPRLSFDYVPAPQSQERLPSFDSIDRITRKNLLTYSLTNVFDRRRTKVLARGAANATVPAAVDDYLDFFRLRVEQSYDRDEAARTEQLATYEKRPFSDIMIEGVIQPEKFVSLTSRTYYSPYLNRATEHEHLLTLTKEQLGEIRFGHDYLHPLDEYKRHRTKDVQVLRLGLDYQITDKLKLTTDYRMDIAAHSDLEKRAGLSWTDQCYNVELLFSRKPSDQSIELRFNLLDFGKQ